MKAKLLNEFGKQNTALFAIVTTFFFFGVETNSSANKNNMPTPVGLNLTGAQSNLGYFVNVVGDTNYLAAILKRVWIFRSD